MTDSEPASTDEGSPSPWVLRFLHLIPPGGRVLDLACGTGRHTRLLAERGHPVTAVDIDVSGLTSLRDNPHIDIRQIDLETGTWPFTSEQFAAVLVCNYLHRPHWRPAARVYRWWPMSTAWNDCRDRPSGRGSARSTVLVALH
jgi:SAM-dependent methyltransferase